METIKQFYSEFGKIIGFMVMTLVIEMTMGQKVEKYWLILILLGMVLLNSEKFNNFLKDKFNLSKTETTDTTNQSTTHTSSSGTTHGGAGRAF